jgi:4-hydroxy-tetrahydrodipicolinate synthase
MIPPHVTIGISGDIVGATGLNAGADAWYSVIGGLFPETALAITRASKTGNPDKAVALADRLEPMWALFRQHGSIRVISAAPEIMGLVQRPSLPLPLVALDDAVRKQITAAMVSAGLIE